MLQRTTQLTARLAASLALCLAVSQAGAAIQLFDYSGALDSGALFSGDLAFDDTGLAGTGDEYFALTDFSLLFMGMRYDLAATAATPEAHFLDGVFVGADVNVAVPPASFALISGLASLDDAYAAFDTSPLAGSEFGSVAYVAADASVPEPASLALLVGGLGIMGWALRRSRKNQLGGGAV
jgi:hypothetical protein